MINFDILKDEYAELTGIEMFNEEGELQDFYREVNKVQKPICGIWHVNPMPLTAVRKPFCGIASVDITVVSHPEVWETTRDKMNAVAAALNGTSREITVNGTVYSVSYNCQTCGVGNRILDANIGHGEVFEIRQQISYIIIESGVSAYDTFLYIDGLQIPFLSLVENKIHTTSNIASNTGEMLTASEAETYGIDFVIPYMKDDSGNLVRDVVDRATGNEAHCVVLDIAGKKHCRLMQFTHVTANVQPPQNIGMNVSMTELDTTAAKFNGMWEVENVSQPFVTVDLTNRGNNACAFVVFWGDGQSDFFEKNTEIAYHIYTDKENAHQIFVFKQPIHYYLPLEVGSNYYGKPLYFRFEAKKLPCETFNFSGEEMGTVLMSNDADVTLNPEKVAMLQTTIPDSNSGRIHIGFLLGASWFYIDHEEEDGNYIYNGQKIQSVVDTAAFVREETRDFIFTSVWD